nr:MAG TPA: terminase small subunit [Caudoviricetes sp.]
MSPIYVRKRVHIKRRMEIYEDIEKKIRKAMREQGTYSKAMEISISLAAGSYMAYLKARDEVSKLDKVCMTRISRENNEYKVVNPEFSVMQDAAEQTRKALRELRLTRATIEADDENDEVDELIKKVENAGKE